MMSTKSLLARIFITVCILLNLRQSAAQNEAGVSIQIIDTSEYVSSYNSDYLDYNLMIASSRGYDSEIVRLINKGAEINAETPEGATPLIFAVANDHLSSVKILLNYQADVNKKTAAWETPLTIAVKNDNLEIAEALIRGGADLDLTDRYGATALHYASIYGKFYLTDLLLYYDAEVDKKSSDGTTPLMAAIWAGNAEVADLLMQNGANLEARDKDGFTPLLIAAQNGDTLLINLLLMEGVDLYEKNKSNFNALDLAIESNSKPAVESLLQHGDKWFQQEVAGENPYTVATAFGRKELFNLLEEKNIPGRPKKRIDELALTVSSKLNNHDLYSGIGFSGKEPLINLGFIVGFDTKLWYTRVLLKSNETDIFYQYRDKSSIIYGGVFKDFTISESRRGSSKLSFSAALSGAYAFGYQLRGTLMTPENKLRIEPSAGIKLQIDHFQLSAMAEYMNSSFYRVGPLWFRLGGSYSFFLSKVKSPGKVIKWY